MPQAQIERIQITAPLGSQDREVLTAEAVRFLSALSTKFEERRQELLERRRIRQQEIDRGVMPQFLPTVGRTLDWVAGKVTLEDLQDRYEGVEITGPVVTAK
ncbi:MAG: hypothetical protein U0Q18_19895 [Bryobacteraceae bacterium]